MLVHGVASVGCGIAWLVAGPRTDRMFSYDPLTEAAKDVSAGFYLYNVMYLAGVSALPNTSHGHCAYIRFISCTQSHLYRFCLRCRWVAASY